MTRLEGIKNFNELFGRFIEKSAIEACNGDVKEGVETIRAGLESWSEALVKKEIAELRKMIRSKHQELEVARRAFDVMNRIELRRAVACLVYDAPVALVYLSTPADKWHDPETIRAVEESLDKFGLFQTEYVEHSEDELNEVIR